MNSFDDDCSNNFQINYLFKNLYFVNSMYEL